MSSGGGGGGQGEIVGVLNGGSEMNMRVIRRMRKDQKRKQWEHKQRGLFYWQSRGAGLVGGGGGGLCESVACVNLQSSKGTVVSQKP